MRTVRGTIRKAKSEAPWAGARVLFELLDGSYTAAAQFPGATASASTAADGTFSIDLWPNEAGTAASSYRCTLPDGSTFDFTLPAGDGSDIELSVLRAGGVINQDWSEALVTTFITTHPDLKGPQGIQGVQGIQGDPGADATVAVGTVTTGAPGTAAAVGNSGTPGAAVFDFTIPRGDIGAQGPQGIQGAQGPQGEQGFDGWSPILAVVVDGERRVLQVTDWTGGEGTKPAVGSYIGAAGLVALIGDAVDIRGAQGIQGVQGEQGPQGETGAQPPFQLELLLRAGTASVADNVLPPGVRIGYALTLTDFYLRAGTAPTGSALTVEVNLNGVLVATVTIAAGATSGSLLGQAIAVAAGDVLTFDITAVGSTTPGADLALSIVGA